MISTPQTVTVGDDVVVNRLGLGTMSLTGAGVWGEPRDPESARRVLRRARELGVDFFDTADSYGPGVAETLVSEALRPYHDLVIATKGVTGEGRTLAGVAADLGATKARATLAWLPHVSATPTPGVASVPHLDENVGARTRGLEPEPVSDLARHANRGRPSRRRPKRFMRRMAAWVHP